MEELSGATVPVEEGIHNYSSNTSRRGKGRDGGGYRNSGSSQRWVPAESRSSSAAARMGKAQEIRGKAGLTDESSQPTTSNGAPSVSYGAVSRSSDNGNGTKYRASGKVHSRDHRPDNNQDRIAKDNVLKGNHAGVTSGRGERQDDVGTAVTASSFVPYLPQDDAVVAGLGEREGGVDASQTQEVTDLLNEQLSTLLRLPPRQFWEKVASDESLSVFLDSYLHFRRRWFDNPPSRFSGHDVSVVAGDGDLSRRVFMVLLRMSSNHDPGMPASEGLSAKEHATILLKRKLLDIPKLMDIAAIYGRDNADLTKRLVSNVCKGQPSYSGELAAYIPPLLEKIGTLHQRCSAMVEANTSPRERGTRAVGSIGVNRELLEVVDFLNDVIITLREFVKAYPPAAKVLVASVNPVTGQGLFLPAVAMVHDTLLPILLKGFAAFIKSAENKWLDSTEIHDQQGADCATQDRLHKLREKLVDFSWKILELGYLAELSGEDAVNVGVNEDAIWKGYGLVQAIVALAVGPSDNDDDSFPGELGSSVTQITGALLQSMEKRHGLYYQIHQACQRGAVILDDAQQEYLSSLLSDTKVPYGGQDNLLIVSTESFPQLGAPERAVEEENVIQQSKISQVKDLFPEYGDGFIAACLEVYDSDPEKVIERILEGTLHSDLSLLDSSLMTKPDEGKQILKDKGKGKVSEQQMSGNGKSIWEKRSSSKESGSSSSLTGNTGASCGYSEGILPDGSVIQNMKLGRYVRRQKGDGTFSELLDSRNGNSELRAAIKAAAAQIEYEDEYDDSFDELGGYVADSGGNEETETLSDQVAHRSAAQGGSLGLRNAYTGKPVILTPWGSVPAKGRGSSVATSVSEQHKVSLMVPEVEDQSRDSPTDISVGQGRGGSRGRGRRKWKEQGPKPQFYLKEGKLYSYKVVGAVGVSNLEEAEVIKQEHAQTIHGLGAGGNVPVSQQDTSSSGRKMNGAENSKFWQGGSLGEGRQQDGILGEGVREHGTTNRGRGAPGRGSYARREDNHHRKDQAMKKHFGGLGGV